MKKLIAILLSILMVASLVGCTKQEETGAKYKVGVLQLAQHVALDAATTGFCNALKDAFGDDVDIEVLNASGDANNCATIASQFVEAGKDLIMANATAALQNCASATSTIPVIGTSITDYAQALGIENWTGVVGTNVSGASDLAPLDQQAAMIKELFPEAKKVALLYCSNEANSIYQCTEIEKYLNNLGVETKWFSFNETSALASICEQACEYADVIYVPTDNACADNTGTIASVVVPAGVPVVAGEEGICKGCGVATLSIDYEEMGYQAGLMAVKILKGEADVKTLPVEYAPTVTKEWNTTIAGQLGLPSPEGYTLISQ